MIEPEPSDPARDRILHVRIGELRTASRGFLKATLGSCVAIAILNEPEGVCGLAHCFLPFAPEDFAGGSARYADRAAANLLGKVAPNPAARRKLRAFLSGGGRLLGREACSGLLQVGQMNVDAARASLQRLNLRFSELEIGGVEGRSALVDCNNFTFTCQKIGAPYAADME